MLLNEQNSIARLSEFLAEETPKLQSVIDCGPKNFCVGVRAVNHLVNQSSIPSALELKF